MDKLTVNSMQCYNEKATAILRSAVAGGATLDEALAEVRRAIAGIMPDGWVVMSFPVLIDFGPRRLDVACLVPEEAIKKPDPVKKPDPTFAEYLISRHISPGEISDSCAYGSKTIGVHRRCGGTVFYEHWRGDGHRTCDKCGQSSRTGDSPEVRASPRLA